MTSTLVTLAAFAVYPYTYRSEAHRSAVSAGTEAAGPAIANLRVELVSTGQLGQWHERSGLYGFTGSYDGVQTLRIVDPLRRYVPRTVAITPPDRESLRRALKNRAPVVPASPKPVLLPVPMRPTHRFTLQRGVTAFLGSVTQTRRGHRVPAPFARVAVERAGLQTHLLHTDDTGRFVLWLPLEVPPLAGSPPPVRFAVRARQILPPPPTSLLADQPAGFDTLPPAAVASTYGPSVTSVHPVNVGSIQPVDLPLP